MANESDTLDALEREAKEYDKVRISTWGSRCQPKLIADMILGY